MIEQLSFLAPTFDGATFEPEHDQARLTSHLARVRTVMLDGCWRTLPEIAKASRSKSEASVSARLRDLRKSKFGAWTVERRPRGERARGLFEYRVSP